MTVPGTDDRMPVPMKADTQEASVREYMSTTPSRQGAGGRDGGGRTNSHTRNASQTPSPNQPWSTRIRPYSFSIPIGSGPTSARKYGMLVPADDPILAPSG